MTAVPDHVDFVAGELLPRASSVTRLLLKKLGAELSRTEVGLLRAVSDGPQRITDLAELEGLAQPTMTILIKQLEERGLVARERSAADGRVVLVSLTQTGADAIEGFRKQIRELLGGYLPEISDDQVEALVAATETLAELVVWLQSDSRKSSAPGFVRSE